MASRNPRGLRPSSTARHLARLACLTVELEQLAVCLRRSDDLAAQSAGRIVRDALPSMDSALLALRDAVTS